jgi:hypothetical protein
MSEIVWLDENNQEIKRETKGRGRPPRGSEKRDDGNFYVTPSANAKEERFVPKYIVLDANDNVVSEENRGKGRARAGFQKASDGEFKGHWVKTEEVKTEVEVADQA